MYFPLNLDRTQFKSGIHSCSLHPLTLENTESQSLPLTQSRIKYHWLLWRSQFNPSGNPSYTVCDTAVCWHEFIHSQRRVGKLCYISMSVLSVSFFELFNWWRYTFSKKLTLSLCIECFNFTNPVEMSSLAPHTRSVALPQAIVFRV